MADHTVCVLSYVGGNLRYCGGVQCVGSIQTLTRCTLPSSWFLSNQNRWRQVTTNEDRNCVISFAQHTDSNGGVMSHTQTPVVHPAIMVDLCGLTLHYDHVSMNGLLPLATLPHLTHPAVGSVSHGLLASHLLLCNTSCLLSHTSCCGL